MLASELSVKGVISQRAPALVDPSDLSTLSVWQLFIGVTSESSATSFKAFKVFCLALHPLDGATGRLLL